MGSDTFSYLVCSLICSIELLFDLCFWWLCSEQGSNSSISSQGVILFLIASVIALIASVIGLRQMDALFETYPANKWIYEAALVIFCLSSTAMTKINGTRWAKYSKIIDSFRVLSVTLLAVSTSSILLPQQLSWLFYAIFLKQLVEHLVKHLNGLECSTQMPNLSSSSIPVGIEYQEPHLSTSPSPLGIQSPVQEHHLSSLPSGNGYFLPQSCAFICRFVFFLIDELVISLRSKHKPSNTSTIYKPLEKN